MKTYQMDQTKNAYRKVNLFVITSLNKALLIGAGVTTALLFTVYQLLSW